MEKDEYICSECGGIIKADESLWGTATETICEVCHVLEWLAAAGKSRAYRQNAV
jgi:DNA-directed RNA polymerase subunit RPC12/RpoP